MKTIGLPPLLAVLLLFALPVQAENKPVAKALTLDGVLIGSAMFADLHTTRNALKSCSACYESNPIATSQNGQLALHSVAFAAVMGANYALRKHGHKDMANGIRWGLTIALTGVAISNARHY